MTNMLIKWRFAHFISSWLIILAVKDSTLRAILGHKSDTKQIPPLIPNR